jgi:isoprenylcysteine carboxyl methyltransferase (ICMT) family protein YpbQ
LHPLLYTFFAAAVFLRLVSLGVSRRNERSLQSAGAREFGAANSTVLALLHAGFYAAGLAEGLWRGAQLDGVAGCGMVLYALSMGMLVVVCRELKELWTVRLYVAPEHRLNRSWLFRTVRHPNYFLNVLPELIGLALVFHAWLTLAVVLPFYLASLTVRIAQEDRAMRERVAGY